MSENSDDNNNDLHIWEPHFDNYKYNEKPPSLRLRSIKPFAMLICSSRNQGKTVMLRHLYEKQFEARFDLVILFSQTIGNGFYEQFMGEHKKTFYDEFDENVLININNIQEKVRKEKGFYLNILVIFDDCVSESIKHNEEIQNLFTRGRHKGISICFITQSPTLVKSTWRQNCTHLIVLRTKGLGLDNLKTNFLLDLIDAEEIPNNIKPDKYLNQIVKKVFNEKYNALVVEYDKEGNSLNDCIFQYKADNKFKIRRK